MSREPFPIVNISVECSSCFKKLEGTLSKEKEDRLILLVDLCTCLDALNKLTLRFNDSNFLAETIKVG